MYKCPGLDMGRKHPEDAVEYQQCPRCGHEIEFFFDDKYRRCPECNLEVSVDDIKLLQNFGCASWCKSADECLGEKLYQRFSKVKQRVDSIETRLNKEFND